VSEARESEAEPNSKLAVVIMAAGKGTRLKSRRPKVLHEIGGKPLLGHVIEAASQVLAPGNIYAVIGHQAEQVKAAVAATGIHFVEQAEQRRKTDLVSSRSLAERADLLARELVESLR